MRPWSIVVALCAVASLATTARADGKLDALATGYQREAETCAIQAGGVAKVVDGATRLHADPGGADDTALADDLAKLTAGRAVIDGYCAELAGVLALIAANPTGTYRSLEHELDARDNTIRRARQASKKAIDELQPVVHRLIPRINARVSSPVPEPHAPKKFPSGHAVDLPAMSGTWRLSGTATTDTADYTDKTMTASVWTHSFASATCEQQRRMLPAADGKDHPHEREPTPAGKQLGVAWIASYVKHTVTPPRAMIVACLPSKDGGWMGTAELDATASPAIVDEMSALIFRMLAAAAAPAQ